MQSEYFCPDLPRNYEAATNPKDWVEVDGDRPQTLQGDQLSLLETGNVS